MGPFQPAEGPGNKQVKLLIMPCHCPCIKLCQCHFPSNLPFPASVIHLHGHDRNTNNECCEMPNCFLPFLHRQPQGTLLFPGQVRKQKLTQESVEVTATLRLAGWPVSSFSDRKLTPNCQLLQVTFTMHKQHHYFLTKISLFVSVLI